MRVLISKDVVQSAHQTGMSWQLHKLLVYAVEGRHTVLFDSSSSAELALSGFDETLSGMYQKALGLCARSAAQHPADVASIRISLTAESKWDDPLADLTLADAIAVLEEPLGIFVENAENDWHFLRGLMRESERKRFMHCVNSRWVVPLHGGGSTLKAQLDKRLAVKPLGLRTYVMFDSDRLHPDEFDPNWSPAREGKNPVACQAYEWERAMQAQIPHRYWRLQRRFIESYIPHSELEKALDRALHGDAIDAFRRMPQSCRWYFNMKGGFEKDRKRDDSERPRDLYAGLSAEDRSLLSNGFGNQLADHYALAVESDFDWDVEAREEAANALPNLLRLI